MASKRKASSSSNRGTTMFGINKTYLIGFLIVVAYLKSQQSETGAAYQSVTEETHGMRGIQLGCENGCTSDADDKAGSEAASLELSTQLATTNGMPLPSPCVIDCMHKHQLGATLARVDDATEKAIKLSETSNAGSNTWFQLTNLFVGREIHFEDAKGAVTDAAKDYIADRKLRELERSTPGAVAKAKQLIRDTRVARAMRRRRRKTRNVRGTGPYVTRDKSWADTFLEFFEPVLKAMYSLIPPWYVLVGGFAALVFIVVFVVYFVDSMFHLRLSGIAYAAWSCATSIATSMRNGAAWLCSSMRSDRGAAPMHRKDLSYFWKTHTATRTPTAGTVTVSAPVVFKPDADLSKGQKTMLILYRTAQDSMLWAYRKTAQHARCTGQSGAFTYDVENDPTAKKYMEKLHACVVGDPPLKTLKWVWDTRKNVWMLHQQ